MRYLSSLFLLAIIVFWSSCRKDFESEPSTGNLQFSTDTLFLDTIFTNIGSSTYSFKVYNRTNDDFTIPSIALERGETSNYRLNVDGIPGKSFEDIQVLAKDSIFVFVETTTDIAQQTGDLEFIYTDRILFDPNGSQQDVDLVTLVKDAVFLFPSRDENGIVETLLLGEDDNMEEIRIEGFFLEDDQLNFTNEKPYVIYGFAAIPPDRTLTIDAGARIHFHDQSGIIAANNSTLLVNGDVSSDPDLLENEVIFESDRLEPGFSDIPGQWAFIWLTAGSTGHLINHATIKNGSAGIIMDSNDGGADPTLTITNSQIYNNSAYGILARTANISGENLVINNSGINSLYASFGGTYNFNHCTFANYWNTSFRDTPAVAFDNIFVVTDENGTITDIRTENLLEANFTNCIIYGNENIELGITRAEGTIFNYNFTNSLIRFEDPTGQFLDNPLYDFTNNSLYDNTIFSENPDFKDPFDNLLNIGEDSAANGQASTPTMGTDILGTLRSSTAPDIGAYESVIFEMDEN
ncbi:hypothetical protein [uncultured Aquimarina sp.]|uniref:hypothetical protein n=1 Tax=uncultured Aquimarina sp. TaxID=575652 RepID=UPI00261718D9|nr:hypothetical protein [uncultured Aquimarina sp.]